MIPRFPISPFWLLVAALLLLAGTASAQQHDLGRATQFQGKYVFYFSQPTATYEVVFSFETPPMPACGVLSERANAVLKAAFTEAGMQQKPFDAVIVSAGSRDVAIRFTGTETGEQRAVARAPKRNGAAVFLLAEPLDAYEPTTKAATVMWWDGIVTGECLGTERVIERQLKKTKATAIIISDRTGQPIRFK